MTNLDCVLAKIFHPVTYSKIFGSPNCTIHFDILNRSRFREYSHEVDSKERAGLVRR